MTTTARPEWVHRIPHSCTPLRSSSRLQRGLDPLLHRKWDMDRLGINEFVHVCSGSTGIAAGVLWKLQGVLR